MKSEGQKVLFFEIQDKKSFLWLFCLLFLLGGCFQEIQGTDLTSSLPLENTVSDKKTDNNLSDKNRSENGMSDENQTQKNPSAKKLSVKDLSENGQTAQMNKDAENIAEEEISSDLLIQGNVLTLFREEIDLKSGQKAPLLSEKTRSDVLLPEDFWSGVRISDKKILELEDGWIEGTPVFFEELLYVGTSDAELYALDLTGKTVFKKTLENSLTGSVCFFGQKLIGITADGTVFALNAKTGEELWRYSSEQSVVGGINIAEEGIFFGTTNGVLFALDFDGQLLWKFEAKDQIQSIPVIADNCVFVAGCDALFHVVDIKTGKKIRAVELEAPTGTMPYIKEEKAFFGTEGNEFLALDWQQGKILWRVPTRKSVRAPAVADNEVVFVPTFNRELFALDVQKGTVLWSFRAKTSLETSPVLWAGFLGVVSQGGILTILDSKTGNLLKEYEFSDNVQTTPIPVPKGILAATDDGILHYLSFENNNSK